jgi:H3 lysine-79-specific histone-lysine N-methyltransferase
LLIEFILGFEEALRPHEPPNSSQVSTLKDGATQRDSDTFCTALAAVNQRFRCLVPSPTQKSRIEEVQDRILKETYQRLVEPNVALLRKYRPFSNNVYGELLPPFVDIILDNTSLQPSSLFIDLGCGVGNIVTQVCLRTGCTGYGVEIMTDAAKLAGDMVKQVALRCHMWGIQCSHMEIEEGDMLMNNKVIELIPHADVVCVNNKVFSADRLCSVLTFFSHISFHLSVNERIKLLLENLKDGAVIVSLEALAPYPEKRLNQRTVRSTYLWPDIQLKLGQETLPLQSCQVQKLLYPPGSMSWAGTGGFFYIQTVDRPWYQRRLFEYQQSYSTLRR